MRSSSAASSSSPSSTSVSRTMASGDARRAPTLRLLQSRVLGRARPRDQGPRRRLTCQQTSLAARSHRHQEGILARGYDAELGAFVQSYGSKNLDASNLMLPLVCFIRTDDPRMAGTIAATERHLTSPRGSCTATGASTTGWRATKAPSRYVRSDSSITSSFRDESRRPGGSPITSEATRMTWASSVSRSTRERGSC